jgi:hypothetical protein
LPVRGLSRYFLYFFLWVDSAFQVALCPAGGLEADVLEHVVSKERFQSVEQRASLKGQLLRPSGTRDGYKEGFISQLQRLSMGGYVRSYDVLPVV